MLNSNRAATPCEFVVSPASNGPQPVLSAVLPFTGTTKNGVSGAVEKQTTSPTLGAPVIPIAVAVQTMSLTSPAPFSWHSSDLFRNEIRFLASTFETCRPVASNTG